MLNLFDQLLIHAPWTKETFDAMHTILDQIDEKYGDLLELAIKYENEINPNRSEPFFNYEQSEIPQFSEQTVENLGIQISECFWADDDICSVCVYIGIGNIENYFSPFQGETDFNPIKSFEFVAELRSYLPLGMKFSDLVVELEFLMDASTMNEIERNLDLAKMHLDWIEAYARYVQYFLK